MGNPLKKLRKHKLNIHRTSHVIIIVTSVVGLGLVANYLLNRSFYQTIFNFHQKMTAPLIVNVPRITVEPSKLNKNVQAHAVPVVFFHGVVPDNQPDNINVTNSEFLSQMVALKKAGFYTITAQQLSDFYAGKIRLYGKPILITFDDGRVDSYLPTDDILKKLGFNAMFFIVSGKQDNHNDAFFLSWSQLSDVHKTGRWDLQAHGWYSHTKVVVDPEGNVGDALTNKMWLSAAKRLETDDEAKARITNDYLQNIKDMKQHFPGHEINTFAVPYGDYGQKPNNFPGAYALNDGICKTYFKICLDIDGQGYNFKQQDPFHTIRLEVVPRWTGDTLVKHLENMQPNSPSFNLDFTMTSVGSIPVQTQLLGTQNSSATGLRLKSQGTNSYMNFNLGNKNSYNYTISTTYLANKASSIYLSGYKYSDNNHSQDVIFGVTGTIANLIVTKDGKDQTLASINIPGFNPLIQHNLKMSLHDYDAVCYLDGKEIFTTKLPVFEPHGTYGYDDYGPSGADVLYRDLVLSSTGD